MSAERRLAGYFELPMVGLVSVRRSFRGITSWNEAAEPPPPPKADFPEELDLSEFRAVRVHTQDVAHPNGDVDALAVYSLVRRNPT